ncbi:MAG: hypothetical protein Harvfovirus43_1, partial [Harvfovirus sp.]
TPIFSVICDRSPSLALEILNIDESINLELRDDYFSTILQRCVQKGNIQMVRELVKKGANIYTSDDDEANIVVVCCDVNQPEIAVYLLTIFDPKKEDFLFKKNNMGFNFLDFAYLYDLVEVIELAEKLYPKKCFVDKKLGVTNGYRLDPRYTSMSDILLVESNLNQIESTLFEACHQYDLLKIQKILSCEVEIDVNKQLNGKNLLCYLGVPRGESQDIDYFCVLDSLFKRGFDAKDISLVEIGERLTTLMPIDHEYEDFFAYQDRLVDFFAMLIDRGANIFDKTNDSDYFSAILAAHIPRVGRLLLERVSINLETVMKHDGMTILLKAVAIGNKKIVDILIKKGANLSAVDNFGKNILSIACECNSGMIGEYLIDLLVDKRIYDIFVEDKNGRSFLTAAFQKNFVGVINKIRMLYRKFIKESIFCVGMYDYMNLIYIVESYIL